MQLTKELYQQTLTDPVAFHKWILGNPMDLTDGQKQILRAIGQYPEVVVIAGSKSGKSTLSAEAGLWGVYRLLQFDAYKKYGLTPGMRIYCMNIAPKEDIAVNVTLQYIKGLAYDSWYLAEYIKDDRRNELEFDKNIIARAQGSSSRAGRGYAIFNLIFDEAASFMDTRGNLSGAQVMQAFVPRLAPFGTDGRFIVITTPQGRGGIAWDLFKTGTPINVIQKQVTHGEHKFRAAFQFATWNLNPLSQYAEDSEFMRKENFKDSWGFDREYRGLFADVVSQFLDPKAIQNCVVDATLPNSEKTESYMITGDPGFAHDNYAIAMGHLDKESLVIVDLVTKFEPPLNIIEVENFFEDLCKRYNVTDIVLDQHLSMATIQRLQDKRLPARGISFGSKTDVKIYQNLLELINVMKIRLPEYEPLLIELRFLQRRILADRYRVEASSGHTDDLADAVALLAYVLNVERRLGGVVMF